MIRQNLIEAAVPSPEQIFDLIVHTENHRQIVWTAGRVLKEAALWTPVEELDYQEWKIVLKRVTGILEEFALQGHLQRRNEPQSIGYGSEIGFDYVFPTRRIPHQARISLDIASFGKYKGAALPVGFRCNSVAC